MKKYPKIKSVQPLAGKRLRVIFENGNIRLYDCRSLLKEDPFAALKDEVLFQSVKAEDHGYAVVWNDEIDLAESEIWVHGRPEPGLS